MFRSMQEFGELVQILALSILHLLTVERLRTVFSYKKYGLFKYTDYPYKINDRERVLSFQRESLYW